jgi:hypothetical protein
MRCIDRQLTISEAATSATPQSVSTEVRPKSLQEDESNGKILVKLQTVWSAEQHKQIYGLHSVLNRPKTNEMSYKRPTCRRDASNNFLPHHFRSQHFGADGNLQISKPDPDCSYTKYHQSNCGYVHYFANFDSPQELGRRNDGGSGQQAAISQCESLQKIMFQPYFTFLMSELLILTLSFLI